MVLAQHEQLISREREIEHLKLLLSKLHRMQFGRKSEKLQRQIEQLELRLEELQSNASEKEPKPSEPASVPACWGTTASKPARRAWPDHLPRQTRRHDPKETVCPQCQGGEHAPTRNESNLFAARVLTMVASPIPSRFAM